MNATKAMRKIVTIDEGKCNGCGLCVPSCAEGAIRIIDGKARLVADNLCDGLGNCLGKCPQDAITVEERPADDFDERAVHEHLAGSGDDRMHGKTTHEGVAHGGCPGSALRMLGGSAAMGGCPGSAMRQMKSPRPAVAAATGGLRQSQLGHWPVQLALVPMGGAIWRDADVLIAADCVPFAYPDFHEKLLAARTLAIACPKLDDVEPYVQKLAAIFANNTVRSVTVAHMEVPCCGGIVYAVREALQQSGRDDIELHDVTIGIDGSLKAQR